MCEYKYEINQVIKDDKKNIVIIDRKKVDLNNKKGVKTEKYYKIHCNRCGFHSQENYINGEIRNEFWMNEYNLTHGSCPCCSRPFRTIVKGINDIWAMQYDIVQYIVNKDDAHKYTIGSGKKILFKCPICGDEDYYKICDVSLKGVPCRNCSDNYSYGEKFMFSMLKQLCVDFKTQYSPDYLNGKRSDFFITDYNIAIEVDGGFHRKECGMTNAHSLDKIKEIDNWKDEQHLKHGVKTVRIIYDDRNHKFDMEHFANEISNSKLENYLDLENINWYNCHIGGLSSRVKEVCDYYINGFNVEEICKMSGMCETTVREYLRKGNNINWCDYTKYNDEEKRIYYEKMKRYNSLFKNKGIGSHMRKPVEVFKDGISLGVFESCVEVSNKSEELFGVKLNDKCISAVCRGEKNSYKGYTFKYIKEEGAL